MTTALRAIVAIMLLSACGTECPNGATHCDGGKAEICSAGAWTIKQDCAAVGGTCIMGYLPCYDTPYNHCSPDHPVAVCIGGP